MPAKTSIKVAITNNAAKDDAFNGDMQGMEWLSEGGSLSGSLNVLGNDPGSASLYGVSGSMPSGTGQMAPSPTSSFSVDFGGTSYQGFLTMNPNGTVGFDLSSLAGKLDSLAENQTVDVTFYYTSKMANGALSTAKVTISITGENDAPVAVAEVIDTNEDDAPVTGSVSASDADNGAQLTYQLVDDAPAGFTFNPDGSYSFDPADEAYQHLAAGAEEVITLTYQVTDEYDAADTETITITITGVNDAAAISGDDTGFVAEDGTLEASGALIADDLDDGEDSFQAQTDAEGMYGKFSVDADGNWTYTLDNDDPDLDSLDAGQDDTDEFTVKSADGTEHTVTVTVNGADEGPPPFVYTPPAAFTGTGDTRDHDDTGDNNSGTSTPGNDQIRGTAANDTINAGSGNDVIYTGAGIDLVTAGPDTGSAPPADNDVVYAGSGDDTVHGGRGNDNLNGGSGVDTINGNVGNDSITGGFGADMLSGGAGADTFVYLDAKDTGDSISDFASGDKIDLAALGVTGFAGALSQAGAVGANEVGYMTSAGVTTLYVDTDGAFGADLEIQLTNGHTPVAGDFLLV